MGGRYKDQIRRRVSVLERNQDSQAGQDDHLNDDSFEMPSHNHRNRPGRKLVPLLMVAGFALIVAWNEIPAVSNAWERTFSPDKWLAKQTCQQAALGQSERKDFSRLLKPGKYNKTSKGVYIDHLVIGEMGETGGEERIQYSCYLDSEGKLASLKREGPAPAPVVQKESDHIEE